MRYKQARQDALPYPRLLPWVLPVLIGAASWCNARYWANHYLSMGVTLCLADCACFSQQASLLPPFVVPLLLFYSGARRTGVYSRRHMYRYASRGTWWRAQCMEALKAAVCGGGIVLTFSVLPGMMRGKPLTAVNWGGVNSLFALMTGNPLQRETSLPAVLLACGAAVYLQVWAHSLLYQILACRLRPLAAFAIVAVTGMACGSPVWHPVWDAASLSYRCWSEPFGAAGVVVRWLAVSAALCGVGYGVCRKVDVL